jgi:acetolactate decarboxylase
MSDRVRLPLVAALLAAVLLAAGCGSTGLSGGVKASSTDTLYQVSTLSALKSGAYDGLVTCASLKQEGDFGLGTFEALDGEMVVLDGKVWRVGVDGVPRVAPDSKLTPFAAVTEFKADLTGTVGAQPTMAALCAKIDSMLPTTNIFYGVKVEGTFPAIQVRSEPAQKKPYPPLAVALEGQKVFNLINVKGTLVGLRCPDYARDINQAGYHFHFLTDDRKAGGHVLALSIASGSVFLDEDHGLEMALPDSKEFYQATPVLATTPASKGSAPTHP